MHRAITEDACKHEFVNCTRTVPITFQSNVQIRNFTHLDEETNGTKANEYFKDWKEGNDFKVFKHPVKNVKGKNKSLS